jgi:hypothetical protein
MATLSRRLMLASSLGVVSCLPASAFAFSIFTVGPAADCPYSTIQAAVDAARDTPGRDLVWISNDLVGGTRHDYANEHVVVNDPDGVVIEGGFVSCADPDIEANDYTTISGTGNDGGPVFEIAGAGGDVSLNNLFITGANRDDDASGGGVAFTGQVGGDLYLFNTSVSLNRAGYGGGINVDGNVAPAALHVWQNSLILNNTAATSGGGIRLEGNARLFVLDPETLIAGNHALGGYGGGIEVLGPARADIGSPGYGTNAVVQFNDAQYGGGIAALAINAGEDATVRVFTTDPHNPVQISHNSAVRTGGGIYLKPEVNFSIFSNASLCAFDFRINDNIAQDGAAIYADEDSNATFDYLGGFVELNESDPCGPESPPALGAVACDASTPCNEIDENVAEDSAGQPTPGSTIMVQSEGRFRGTRFNMRRNRGAHALREVNDALTTVYMFNCLIADNEVTEELIYGVGDPDGDNLSQLSITNCTLAGNAIGAANVIRLEAFELDFENSIVDQPGVATLSYVGPHSIVDYLLSNDTSTLPVNTGVLQGEPTFFDPTNGDYHLQRTSLGVDFAPAANGLDLDRRSRTVDLPDVANEYGPLDLGAYEIQIDVPAGCAVADTVFCNGFES